MKSFPNVFILLNNISNARWLCLIGQLGIWRLVYFTMKIADVIFQKVTTLI